MSQIKIRGKANRGKTDQERKIDDNRTAVRRESHAEKARVIENPSASVDVMMAKTIIEAPYIQATSNMETRLPYDTHLASLPKIEGVLREQRQYKNLRGDHARTGTPTPDWWGDHTLEMKKVFADFQSDLIGLVRGIAAENTVKLDQIIEQTHRPLPIPNGTSNSTYWNGDYTRMNEEYMVGSSTVNENQVWKARAKEAKKEMAKYPRDGEFQFLDSSVKTSKKPPGALYRGDTAEGGIKLVHF